VSSCAVRIGLAVIALAAYVITVQRGGPGITYRIASRKPLTATR
jgi:hypothetical protein